LSNTRTSITTRQQLIDHTIKEWNRFVAFIDRLSEDQWTTPRDGAGWSVKDHVSHVTRWDIAVIELFCNGVPMCQTLGISDSVWSAEDYEPLNEQIRQGTIDDSVKTVKSDRDVTWSDLVALLHEMSDDQLSRPAAGSGLNVSDTPPSTVLQTFVEYLGGHYRAHLGYIRNIHGGQTG